MSVCSVEARVISRFILHCAETPTSYKCYSGRRLNEDISHFNGLECVAIDRLRVLLHQHADIEQRVV